MYAVKCMSVMHFFLLQSATAGERTICLPPELGLESDAKPKKKRKERSEEEKIPEANTDKHLKSFPEKKYLQADTGAVDMDQDLRMGKENDQRPSNNLAAYSLLWKKALKNQKVKGEKENKNRKRLLYEFIICLCETGLSAGSLLPTLDEGSEKPESKRRKREQEQKTHTDNYPVVPERADDENTSVKATKKKKQKCKVQNNDENMDVARHNFS
ncbi:hypothetical protein POM88_030613 [Heracleum sosnowskyi]|uniref:Uncharacterized protein n=1 Tax=Heracleum sosnowskyi TaxID=360622 RepID=A0AAD8HW93_9APIA|nr:hypothetical protein POM88_030613 [Heracleum sosnowskyi]